MSATTILQDRVAARLAELRRSPRDVSLKAGLGPDAIRTILKGRSRSPRGETLAALASELECDVAYLLGTQDTPFASDTPTRQPDGSMTGTRRLGITYKLSSRWEQDDEDLPAPYTFVRSDIYSLPDYYPGSQELHLVEDRHANDIAPPGSYLHVRSLLSPDFALDLQDRDLVILHRQRLSASGRLETQVTCRRIRLVGTGAILEFPSSTETEDILIDFPKPNAEGDRSAIRSALLGGLEFSTGDDGRHEARHIDGLVLRSITVLTGPAVQRETYAPEGEGEDEE